MVRNEFQLMFLNFGTSTAPGLRAVKAERSESLVGKRRRRILSTLRLEFVKVQPALPARNMELEGKIEFGPMTELPMDLVRLA
jgi:hypothetical protein